MSIRSGFNLYNAVITTLALIVTVIAVVVSIYLPEIRSAMKLDVKNETGVGFEQGKTGIPTTAAALTGERKKQDLQPNTNEIEGTWRGSWISASGARYSAEVELQNNNGQIRGRIFWTLEDTINPERISRIGLSATEYVSGYFNNRTNELYLAGDRKDDSGGIIILDKYKLNFSQVNKSLSGFSYGGKTRGQISLVR